MKFIKDQEKIKEKHIKKRMNKVNKKQNIRNKKKAT